MFLEPITGGNGTLIYPRHAVGLGTHVHYAGYNRSQLILVVKSAVADRLDPWKRLTKHTVPDWLLADVAMELGFNPKSVVELMEKRPYKWR